MEFYYFSFLQGVLAFLAPCAVALLPGYILAFISRNSGLNQSISHKLARGIKLAMLSIAGILAVYIIAGAVIIVAAELLKQYMKWITISMGGGLVILGMLMVAGKNMSISLNVNQATNTSEMKEAFGFGVAFAIGALGCLFPLFLVVATQAMAAPSAWTGAGYFAAYFSGISLMMIGSILLAVFAKEFLMKYLRKILPYMEIITGTILILAGAYVIYYQMILF